MECQGFGKDRSGVGNWVYDSLKKDSTKSELEIRKCTAYRKEQNYEEYEILLGYLLEVIQFMYVCMYVWIPVCVHWDGCVCVCWLLSREELRGHMLYLYGVVKEEHLGQRTSLSQHEKQRKQGERCAGVSCFCSLCLHTLHSLLQYPFNGLLYTICFWINYVLTSFLFNGENHSVVTDGPRSIVKQWQGHKIGEYNSCFVEMDT